MGGKRNITRFPGDFMLQLTMEEAERLRYQTGTLKTGRGRHRCALNLPRVIPLLV